ncbi:MAG: transporter substrate-binding domain-containing protein [Alphaproteobacteria bacterium]|nr:transporter substrate-binding domain-containing protein [Alphaproteobacteria bacterium]
MKHILLAAAFAAAMTGGAAAQTVRLGTEGAYAPWNFVNDAGEVDGFEIELGNELCVRAALECEWVVNEWDTIIPNLLAGNYDAIIAGMSITDERKETIDFSDNYYPPDPSKFAVAGDSAVDFDAMSGLKIGVQGATIQAAYAEATFGAGNTILSFETADQSIADLSAGNVDVVLADGGYLDPIVNASGGALKIAGPDVMIGGGVGAGLRKDDDELEGKLNAAIAAMKADGSLNELIVKWFDPPNTF